MVDKEFFHQCVIRNRSVVPFVLNSIRVRSWTSGSPRPRVELVNDDICDLKALTTGSSGDGHVWQSSDERSLSLGLTLGPEECYFFSGRFCEQFYTANSSVRQTRRFDPVGMGGKSPLGGQADDVAVRPALVNVFLGRRRSQWVTGNVNIFSAGGSLSEDEKLSAFNYFKEFWSTYDPDMFGNVVAVSAPASSPQDLIHISAGREKEIVSPRHGGSISPDLVRAGSPISADATTQLVNLKCGFPQECVVFAELVASPERKGATRDMGSSGKSKVYARIGSPVMCSYKVRFLHLGCDISGISKLERHNVLR